MAKLTMSEKGDREDVVRVSRPARRLASLEDMDVDDPSRGSKRKRDSSRDSEFVVSDGWADDEEKPLWRCAPRRVDAGKKRTAKRVGTFRDPPCTLCARLGCPCEDQLHQLSYKSACCACHEAKHTCKGSGGARCQDGNVAVPRKRSQQAKAPKEKVVESEDSLSERDVRSTKARGK